MTEHYLINISARYMTQTSHDKSNDLLCNLMMKYKRRKITLLNLHWTIQAKSLIPSFNIGVLRRRSEVIFSASQKIFSYRHNTCTSNALMKQKNIHNSTLFLIRFYAIASITRGKIYSVDSSMIRSFITLSKYCQCERRFRSSRSVLIFVDEKVFEYQKDRHPIINLLEDVFVGFGSC